MALQGHASVVVFDAPAVVVVEQTVSARFAMGWAAITLPVGFVIALMAVDPRASVAVSAGLWLKVLGATVLAAGVLALLRGTVRARLLLDNKELDRLEWTFRPHRRLSAKVGARTLEVEFSFNPQREVEFYLDGALLKKLEVR